MAHLRLVCLGSLRIFFDGVPLSTVRSSRVQSLLAYLAIEADRAHSRDALAALFWPDESERAAKQNLRQALYELRQLLGEPALEAQATPFLRIVHTTVQFDPNSDYSLDVALFRAHLRERRLEAAVELYQGELLAGLSSGSEQFEEWLTLTREQLHLGALDALDQLAQQALEQANYPEAQRYARHQLALEPWREEAHCQLIAALAATGQRSAALAQYDTCRRVLASELGVEPAETTSALAEQIRAGTIERALKPYVDRERFAGVVSTSPVTRSRLLDWGEAPDSAIFHGRQAELAELQRWLVDERARLVLIVGMGGMGKTALAAQAARHAAGQFDVVIWRSLLNAPPLDNLLREWLQALSDQQLAQMPERLDAQLALLFDFLRLRRCLLVLDNAESIMDGGEHAGRYRPGYAGYGLLFQRMGESQHQSCLIMTSREQPAEVARLERAMPQVRTLPLAGLDVEAGQAILATRGVTGAAAEMHSLIQSYSGNPLALFLIAETIAELFDGDIAAFLHDGALIFDDIRTVLDHQFARRSALEQAILLWLAIEREPISIQQLSRNFARLVPRPALLESLSTLRRHGLLERTSAESHDNPHASSSAGGFTLQNVVTEYLTDYLIRHICQEVEAATPDLLHSHALLKADAKEYVRQSQARLIVQPISEQLQAQLSSDRLEATLQALLSSLRQGIGQVESYAAGNLLNLLIHMRVDLRRYDFSHLAVWQAYLQGAFLPQLNFAHADLAGAAFMDRFSAITALAFSPDGQVLGAGTSAGEIRLWRVTDGQPCGRLVGHSADVWSLAFTPASDTRPAMLASCSDDMAIYLWDLGSQGALATNQARIAQVLRGHTEGVWDLDLCPDGRLLASASADHTVRIWDIASGQARATLAGHTQGVRAVAFSPDGALLASGSEDATIGLWDVASGRLLTRLTGHSAMIWCLAFSPDGRFLASGGDDQAVRLWELPARQPAPPESGIAWAAACHTLPGHTSRVTAVAFCPVSRLLVSSSDDQTLRIWDVARRQIRTTMHGHADVINCAVFSPDGTIIASGGADQSVRLWNTADGHALRALHGHTQGIMGLAFSPDGRLLANACTDGHVRLWDIQSHTLAAILHGHSKQVEAVAYSPDGAILASSSADQTIRLWDARSGRLRQVLAGHAALVRSLAFSPDGALLISGSSDRTVRVWDARTGELRRILQGQRSSTWSVACHPNGTLVAGGCTDDTVYLWDLRQPPDQDSLPLALYGHTTWVTSVAFSPDGALLASGSGDQTVRVWNAHTGELLHTLCGHRDWVYGVTICALPAGALLASCSADKTICVWDLPSGRLLHQLRGHTGAVRSVGFSPDGMLLASGSTDETVRLWDARTGAELHTLRAPRPYEGMNITGATGITEAQKAALRALGAVEDAG